MNINKKIALLAISVLASLLIIGCSTSASTQTTTPASTQTATPVSTQTTAKCGDTTVKLGDLSYDSATIQAHALNIILREGFKCETEIVQGSVQILAQSVSSGDIQIFPEVWLPNAASNFGTSLTDGTVLTAAETLVSDRWESLFTIPKYVQEQYPDLQTLADLKDYADIFKRADSDGKAALVTCPAGWACEKVNATKFESYMKSIGLDEYAILKQPGSGEALSADLQGAYERKEPWIGYMWSPSKDADELDLVYLDEAEYTTECWNTTKECNFPSSEIYVAYHSSLPDNVDASIIQFLNDWGFTTADYSTVTSWAAEQNQTFETASVYLLQNTTGWEKSVSTDVAKNVKDYLATLSQY